MSDGKVFRVDVSVTVEITISDREVLDRALTPEFAAQLYTFDSHEEVLEHLAFNAAVNGVRNASSLDGWADLEKDAVVMTIDSDSFRATVQK